MIFPFLQGLRGFHQAPLTWSLITFNILLFLIFLPQQFLLQQSLESHLNHQSMQATHGRIYLSYLSGLEPLALTPLQTELLLRQEDKQEVLTQSIRMAMQDSEFLAQSKVMTPVGDLVAFTHWQTWIRKFKQDNALRPMSSFGLTLSNSSWVNMITYQYIHANSMHLLTNMIVLLIFGSVLEPILGSLIFLLIYTVAGVAGAFAFVHFNGLGVAPLVGASAAISGLMAFYGVVEHRKRVAFAYLLGPFRGFYGLIYLPTWLIFPVCFLSDVASILQSGTGFGGIAYAAHLGGAVMGLIIAVAYRPLLLFGRSKTTS